MDPLLLRPATTRGVRSQDFRIHQFVQGRRSSGEKGVPEIIGDGGKMVEVLPRQAPSTFLIDGLRANGVSRP